MMHPKPLDKQRGAASLAVVMVLFFILAMVAAYTNRNLVFEQRTSANSYRAARSLAAAEAAADWTIGMLNGGVIGTSCTSAGATSDFRTRYLELESDGKFKPRTWDTIWDPTGPRIQAQPSCSAKKGGGWDCGCPDIGGTPPAALSASNDEEPVFTVGFIGDLPGVVSLKIRACHTVRSGVVTASNVNAEGSCHVNDLFETNELIKAKLVVDSLAMIRVSVGLVSALPVAPSAALTVRGTITQSAGTLRVINQDPLTGLALRSGSPIADPTTMETAGPAGSTSATKVDGDTDLSGIAAGDFFRSTLGLPEASYREQPAALAIKCSGACNASASVLPAVASGPTRIIVVDGDLNLDTSSAIGTSELPTMLVVTGNVTVSQPITFKGVIYAEGNVTWSASGGTILGALISAGDYVGSGNAAIAYDRAIVQRIHKGYGSFVRVPGSWRMES